MSRIPTQPPRQRQPRERDRKYLDSFRDSACEACGTEDGTVVGAHMSMGNFARGMKADDALAVGLCGECHRQADSDIKLARIDVWFRVLKKLLRDRHRERQRKDGER